ncbi:unnamed protein product [Urochloa decumbens]|uniref:F-box domain-containing protein n=1 Tax=Urochloa decumbens TaxID=240449 RepID=A0ABC9GDA1_9POAL
MAEALVDKLVEEILLRIAPDDPTRLFRAALVCRRWHRLACDPGFRRRFREFHRRRPSASHARLHLQPQGPWQHLRRRAFHPLLDPTQCPLHPRIPRRASRQPHQLARARLPPWPRPPPQVPLRHHGRVGSHHGRAGAWSEVASAKPPIHIYGSLRFHQPVLAGTALYMFKSPGILKYDLIAQKMSEIHLPRIIGMRNAVLMTTEDGMGFTGVVGSTLYLWSWESASDKGGRWAQTKVIELEKILPADALLTSPHVLGFADGLGLVFLWTNAGLFTIDGKSEQVRKLGKLTDAHGSSRIYNVVPYTSFCTPISRGVWSWCSSY